MTRWNIFAVVVRVLFYLGTLGALWVYLHMPLATFALGFLYVGIEAGVQASRMRDKRVPLVSLADY